MRAAPDRAGARDTPAIADLFTEDELRRLIWLRGAGAAERHLVPLDQPCPEHQACRRLAFALWMYATHRLSEGDQPLNAAATALPSATPATHQDEQVLRIAMHMEVPDDLILADLYPRRALSATSAPSLPAGGANS